MNVRRLFHVGIAIVTGVTCVLPAPLIAAAPPNHKTTSRQTKPLDVRLQADGTFVGQLVTTEGVAVRDAPVELLSHELVVERVQTDASGQFRFRLEKSGLYRVRTGDAIGLYRVWRPEVAPPVARHAILLVQGDPIRGQHKPRRGVYDGTVTNALSSPWVFAGLVAAGIAVPIAISNDDDREGS